MTTDLWKVIIWIGQLAKVLNHHWDGLVEQLNILQGDPEIA